MMKRLALAAAVVALAGCSAKAVAPNATGIQLSNERPGASCRYIGEAMGSQGNFWTGDYTSNQNLMEGARNDLRNKAATMGGNYVWVQNVSNAQAHGSLGTSNTTVVGNIYNCPNGVAVAPVAHGTMTSPTPTTAGRQSITTPEAGVVTTGGGPATMDSATLVQQTLGAQKVASAQGCGDVQPAGESEFKAMCTGFSVVIRCNGASCSPIRTER